MQEYQLKAFFKLTEEQKDKVTDLINIHNKAAGDAIQIVLFRDGLNKEEKKQ